MRYDNKTIALHWISALLVGLLWLIGQTIDMVPRGPWQIDYRSIHVTTGVTLAIILILRTIWRLTGRTRLPPINHGLLHFVAEATHWLLYGLLYITIMLGLFYVWVRGDSIFNLFSLPAFDPANQTALQHLIGDRHALAANALIIVAGVHAVAALFHHYVQRDATLRRMLPWDSE